jgi:urate oxidase
MIEFNDNTNLHNVVVMDITGKIIQSFTDYKQNSLLINTDEMSKGIYFIKASNTRNESVTSKLIVR